MRFFIVTNKHCFGQCKNSYSKNGSKCCRNIKYKFNILRPYCPDLNPIEDVWRVIKKTIYKTTYNSAKELINLFKEKFYEIIEPKSFYENWLELNGINF